MNPITAWRIHLGAHKTATTHVQMTLGALRPALLARGVDFIPLGDLRRSEFAATLGQRRAWSRVPLLRGPMARRAVARGIEPLRAGPPTVVLSEEKLIGGSQHVFSQPIYPRMQRIVALLAPLGRRAEVTLFLAVRSFDTQLPSAYVQELRFMPPLGGGFDAIRSQVLANPPSWFELVRRIRAAAPGIALRVWRHEDYRAHAGEILAALAGTGDLGPLPEVADPAWTRSPGLEAIRAVEALPPMPEPERRERARAIFRADPGDGPRFQPFDAGERARLQAGYAADLERIAALDPEILLRF